MGSPNGSGVGVGMIHLEQKHQDEMWAKMVQDAAGHQCEYCRRRGVTRASVGSFHVFRPTMALVLRHSLQNGVALCRHHSRVKDRAPMLRWFMEYRKDDWLLLKAFILPEMADALLMEEM